MTARRAYLLGPVLALALLPSNLVAAAVPLLMAEWEAGAAAIGWVFSAYQVGYLIGVVFLLPLTDRVRTGLVITGCAVVTSAAFVAFPLLAHDVWSAVALRVLAGLGLAGIYLPGVRVVAGAVPAHRRGFAVGAYVSSFYLGTAVSLWLTGALLPHLGWRGAGLGMGVLAVLAIPIAWFATQSSGPPPGGRSRLDLTVVRVPGVLRVILGYTGHSWELYVSRGWLAAYLAALARGERPPREVELLPPPVRLKERVMLSLRLDRPLSMPEVAGVIDERALPRLEALRLVERRGEELALTFRGRFLGDAVTAELLV